MRPSPINRTAGRPMAFPQGRPPMPQIGRPVQQAPAQNYGKSMLLQPAQQANPVPAPAQYGRLPPRQQYAPSPQQGRPMPEQLNAPPQQANPVPYGQVPRQPYQPPPNPYARPPMPQPGAPQHNPMAKFNQQGRPIASRANLLPNQMNTWQQRFNGAKGGRATGQPAAMSRMRQLYGGGGAPVAAMPNPATAQPGQSARGLMASPYGGGG